MSRKITLGVVGKSAKKQAEDDAALVAQCVSENRTYVEGLVATYSSEYPMTVGIVSGTLTAFHVPNKNSDIFHYCCYDYPYLTSVDLRGAKSIGDHAFMRCWAVDTVDSREMVVSQLGEYAFSEFGAERSDPDQHVLKLDFSSSTFEMVNAYSLGTPSATHKLTYMEVHLPQSLKYVQNFGFAYMDHCDLYFHGNAPKLMGTGCFQGISNCNIYVTWKDIWNYKNMTNWVSRTTIGCSFENEFELYDYLPEYDAAGHQLTWYSDAGLTTTVTQVLDPTAKYYCSVSSTVVASAVTVITDNATVVIKDGNDKVYPNGSAIPHGTTVTVTVTPTTDYVPYILTINGVAASSGDTFTAASGSVLNIVAVYYDGENLPIDPTFANNSWPVIQKALQDGNIPSTWDFSNEASVTKPVTLTNGDTHDVFVCDNTQNRYEFSTFGTYSNYVFKFKTSIMNSTRTNGASWSNDSLNTTVCNQTIYNLLPSELKQCLKQVRINSCNHEANGSANATLTYSDCYVFLPSNYEIFGSAGYSNTLEQSSQFSLYARNNNNNYRITYNLSATAVLAWLRSPHAGGSSHFCLVYTYGTADSSYYYSSYGVSPCFVLA